MDQRCHTPCIPDRKRMDKNCWYLDFLTTIDISYCATWKQRSRYENSLVLGVNDGPHPGPMRKGTTFRQPTRRRAALHRGKNEWMSTFQRKKERQRPFNETLRADLEWHSHNWRSHWSQAASSTSTEWWESAIWHELDQGEWPDQHEWEE